MTLPIQLRGNLAGWLLGLATGAALAACSGDSKEGSDSSASGATPAATTNAAAPTATQAPAATAAPTPRLVVVTQAMLGPMAFSQGEAAPLYGITPFMQNRTNVADIPSAFASSPELGQFLTSQQVAGLYNAWTATGPCTVCGVQIPVMFFPNGGQAGMGYDRIRQVNQMIFQNIAQQMPLGAYWDASFCQTGTFTTTGGQMQNWYFCAMRKGNAVISTAIGGFNINAMQVGDAIRGYATRVENYLKTQFP